MKKTYSIKRVFTLMFSISAIMIFALFISIYVLYFNKLKEQEYDNAYQILDMYNSQSSSQNITLYNYLYNTLQRDNDIATLNSADDENKYYHSMMAIYSKFSRDCNIFPGADGFFLYSAIVDEFIPYNKKSDVTATDYIHDYLSANKKHLSTVDSQIDKWSLHNIDGDFYLIMYIRTGQNVIGAWVKSETITASVSHMLPDESLVYLATENKGVINKPNRSMDMSSAFNEASLYPTYTSPEKVKYLTASRRLVNSNCLLLVLIPQSRITTAIIPIFIRIFVIQITVLSLVFLLLIISKRLVAQPLNALSGILENIQSKDSYVLIPENSSRCLEINQINSTLNSLLSEIKNLKITMYEKQLAQTKIEMQLVKSQISPHFLINCLSSFAAMATSESSDPDLIQRLIFTLSNHIRNTFASKGSIALSDESEHVDNYLELVTIRYPGSLGFHIDIEDDVSDATIYPMLLMTLTENSIKHNIIMGQLLTINISAKKIIENDEESVKIVFIDNGSGYSDLALDLNNNILEHSDICADGNNIGIYNITKALSIMFGTKYDIHFSNEPGSGARVDITFPYIRFTPNNEVRFNEYPDRR